jgi:hypothetical protein
MMSVVAVFHTDYCCSSSSFASFNPQLFTRPCNTSASSMMVMNDVFPALANFVINHSLYMYFYHEFQIGGFVKRNFEKKENSQNGEVQHFQVVGGHLFMIVKTLVSKINDLGNFKNEYI